MILLKSEGKESVKSQNRAMFANLNTTSLMQLRKKSEELCTLSNAVVGIHMSVSKMKMELNFMEFGEMKAANYSKIIFYISICHDYYEIRNPSQ
jgi:hypothetical protein